MRKVFFAKSVGFYINLLSYVRPQAASFLAYRFFSQPRAGRLRRQDMPPILREAQTKTFRLPNGHEFHSYLWPGNQNVILLAHGWESNAARWEKMLPYLQKTGSTIVAIDGPAHGLSGGVEFNMIEYAEAINIAVNHYNPTYLIGHSMGGATCVFYQHKYQNEALRKMVLLGAPSDLRTLVNNFAMTLSLNTRMIRLLEQYFLRRFSVKIDEFSGKIFGSGLQLSGIIAHDVEDTVVSFEEARKIASSWKHATFIETKGLGHSMHDDALYRRVASFLIE